MIIVTVGNDIKIAGLPEAHKQTIKKSLTILNQEFFKFQRMGIWAPRDFKYYKEDGRFLIIPRGCFTRLNNYLAKNKIESELIKDWVEIGCSHGESNLVLRDYQEPIVNKIVDNRPSEGILISSTGSGKTLMSLEILHRLGLTATILVHNTVLSDQFRDEAKKFYGITASIIDANHKDIGNLTIATFQSLMADPELAAKLAERTSILFVDEAQGICSKERQKVLKAFRPRFLYGLTATAERTDSLTPAIFFLLGQPIAEYNLTQATPTVEVIRTGVDIPITDNYHDIVEAMVNHKSRNTLIAGLATGEALQKRKVLVLTKRRKHYENLKEKLDFKGVYYIDVDDPERNNLLARLKTGEQEFSIILGTFSLLGTGVDIPSLDCLIIASDLKSSVLTVQGCGRILRLFEGKKDPIIYDLWDDKNQILTRQFFERKKVYLKKGWKIKL